MPERTHARLLILFLAAGLPVVLAACGDDGPSQAPLAEPTRSIRVVDIATNETLTVTAQDWYRTFRVDAETGYRIDDKGRAIAIAIKCASCGAEIAAAPVPVPKPGRPLHEEVIKWDYICPKCRKHAYRPKRERK